MYSLTGTVKVIFDKQTFDSGFTKRELVVTTEETYPQDVKLECIKERCDLLDNVTQGDKVTVHFNLRGNEYNDRYFVNLQAWKIEQGDKASGASGAPASGDGPPGWPSDTDVPDEEMPF